MAHWLSGPLSDWCHLISCTGLSFCGWHCARSSPGLPSACRLQRCSCADRPKALTAFHYFWFPFHQSTSSPTCKTPLNPTAHPVLLFKECSLLLVIIPLLSLYCNPSSDRYFLSVCYNLSSNLPCVALRHWSPFVQSIEAFPSEKGKSFGGCSDNSRGLWDASTWTLQGWMWQRAKSRGH